MAAHSTSESSLRLSLQDVTCLKTRIRQLTAKGRGWPNLDAVSWLLSAEQCQSWAPSSGYGSSMGIVKEVYHRRALK